MIAPPIEVRARWRRIGGLLGAAIIVAGAILVVEGGPLSPWMRRTLDLPLGWSALILAMLLYQGAHFFRAVRLALLVGGPDVSLRGILSVHYQSAALGLVLPFKLGDLVRVALLRGLAGMTGGWTRALLTVWGERVTDAVVIGFFLVLLLLGDAAAIGDFGYLLLLYVFFVAGTLFVFLVVPENLKNLSFFVMRRYNGGLALGVLGGCQWASGFLSQSHGLFRRRVVTLLVLTGVVWGLEVASVGVVVHGMIPLDGSDPAVLKSLMDYLGLGSLVQMPAGLGLAAPGMVAIVLTRVPLLAVGLIASLEGGLVRHRR
jgi:hypothetical protein